MKQCSECGEVKPITDFPKNKTRKDGFEYRCKSCKKNRSTKYYETHKHDIGIRTVNYEKCVKSLSCPLVGGRGAEFVILSCNGCGIEFRKRKALVDYWYETRGQTAFYCSRDCYHESTRKIRTLDYKKRIDKIKKENK